MFQYQTAIREKERADLWSWKWTQIYDWLEQVDKQSISSLSVKQLSKVPIDKQQELINLSDAEIGKEAHSLNEQDYKILPTLIDELEHIEDNIWNYVFNAYLETYSEKKKALLALVNFAPAVQNAVAKVSSYWKYFESERDELESISSDLK